MTVTVVDKDRKPFTGYQEIYIGDEGYIYVDSYKFDIGIRAQLKAETPFGEPLFKQLLVVGEGLC